MTPGFEGLAGPLCRWLADQAEVPFPIVDFDDEWSPAGDTYRAELLESGLIEQTAENFIVLTPAGTALALEQGPPAPAVVVQPQS